MSKVKNKPAAAAKAAQATQAKVAPQPVKEVAFIFGKTNYLLMGLGIVLLLIGYIIMGGGASDPKHPEIFNAAEKYSFTRITLAPIIVVLGLVVEAIAIMYKPKEA